MCPEITTLMWFSTHALYPDSGMCMQTTVPTPALASSAYILSGADVPPVILATISPQRLSLFPTRMRGGSLSFAKSRYSGSFIRVSTMSPTVRGRAS